MLFRSIVGSELVVLDVAIVKQFSDIFVDKRSSKGCLGYVFG